MTKISCFSCLRSSDSQEGVVGPAYGDKLTIDLRQVDNARGNPHPMPAASTQFSLAELPLDTLTAYFNELVPKNIREGKATSKDVSRSNLEILIADSGIPLLSFLNNKAVDKLVVAVSELESSGEKVYAIRLLSRVMHRYLSASARALLRTMVKAIPEEHDRAEMLGEMNMTGSELDECVRIANIGLSIKNENALAWVLETLLPQLKIFCRRPEIQDKVITATKQIKEEALRVEVLTAGGIGDANLKSNQYNQLIEAAEEIKGPVLGPYVLGCLAVELSQLEAKRRELYISQALNNYEKTKQPQILIGLAERINFFDLGELRRALFNKVEGIDNEEDRQSVIGPLAKRAIYLSSNERQNLAKLTDSFDVLFNWIEGMAEADLDVGLRRQIVEEFVSPPLNYLTQLHQIKGLRLLGWNLKYVPEDQRQQVLEAMRDTPTTLQSQASTLEGFLANVDVLPKTERELVFNVFNELIANSAPKIRGPLLSIALDVARRYNAQPATKAKSRFSTR